jgi:serine/threonine protein kinase
MQCVRSAATTKVCRNYDSRRIARSPKQFGPSTHIVAREGRLSSDEVSSPAIGLILAVGRQVDSDGVSKSGCSVKRAIGCVVIAISDMYIGRRRDVLRDGRTMLVFEDPGGAPLDRLLGRPVDVAQFLRVAIPLASALGRVHARGLIHKDIKPANILVDSTSGGVWLTGFGIASRLPRRSPGAEPVDLVNRRVRPAQRSGGGRRRALAARASDNAGRCQEFVSLLPKILVLARGRVATSKEL